MAGVSREEKFPSEREAPRIPYRPASEALTADGEGPDTRRDLRRSRRRSIPGTRASGPRGGPYYCRPSVATRYLRTPGKRRVLQPAASPTQKPWLRTPESGASATKRPTLTALPKRLQVASRGARMEGRGLRHHPGSAASAPPTEYQVLIHFRLGERLRCVRSRMASQPRADGEGKRADATAYDVTGPD
jgi:hypothetical protein